MNQLQSLILNDNIKKKYLHQINVYDHIDTITVLCLNHVIIFNIITIIIIVIIVIIIIIK